MKNKTLVFGVFSLVALFGFSLTCRAQTASFIPAALPSSRSAYVIFNHYLSLPPFTASLPSLGAWVLDPSLLVSNVLIDTYSPSKGNTTPARYFDYESLSFELPVEVGIGNGWSLGADLQVSYFSGGFLDGIINSFHGLFGFPNDGRNLLPDSQVFMNVNTKNGVNFQQDSPVLTLSDPVFTVGRQLIETANFQASVRAAVSVPLGLGAGLVGAGLPGAGLGVYVNWEPETWLTVLGAGGVLVPGESLFTGGPIPMVTLRLSLVFDPDPTWIVLPFVDFNLHTSPFQDAAAIRGQDFFAEPNMDMLFGILVSLPAMAKKGEYGAFNVQEDPFIHNTADVSFQANAAITIP